MRSARASRGARSTAPRAGALAVAASLLLGGCVAALPAATFGPTTPEARTDLAVGSSIRLARAPSRAASETNPDLADVATAFRSNGFVPLASARYGIGEHRDLGVLVSGSGFRFDLRFEHVTKNGSTRKQFVFGLAPSYLALPVGGGGLGHLVGVEPVVAYSIDFGSLYEVWFGPRLLTQGLFGTLDDASGTARQVHGARLELGLTFGVAAGIRRVHGFVEITASREFYFGAFGDASLRVNGMVLTPAFGLRVRI